MRVYYNISYFIICFFCSFGMFGAAYSASYTECKSGNIANGDGKDLRVTGDCTVNDGTYHYGNVNIYGGGSLEYIGKGKTNFWAKNIVIEDKGNLIAGSPEKPFGSEPGQVLTIYLYGKDQGVNGSGVTCIQDKCGIPTEIWDSNGSVKKDLKNGITDYFYQYKPMFADKGDPHAYFGYKVLAVSFGGTLKLFGYKGANYDESLPEDYTAPSWVRLAKTVEPNSEKSTLFIDQKLKVDNNWQEGDQIVITTTDYMPGHSELLSIESINGNSVDVKAYDSYTYKPLNSGVRYTHNGEVYSLTKVPQRLNLDIKVNGQPAIETRAAIALLTRSIRIVSAGDNYGEEFPAAETGYYFGGHTVIRQGFKALQIQGVEFYQMGQGGRMGHYPVHFHMARKVPKDTFVKDSSIHDSMTRWITLHATEGVKLQRNVGFLSIGHGYYIEDGSEINNQLIGNIGILARAAVDNIQNPRTVPGILSAPDIVQIAGEDVPYKSDAVHPTIFWIMNGWNDFRYNMAAGATACGLCYWMLPSRISGHSMGQKWDSYASLIKTENGLAPLKSFVGNSCSSAYISFNTIDNVAACQGFFENTKAYGSMGVINNLAPTKMIQDPQNPDGKILNPDAKMYYPNVIGGIKATTCDANSVGAGGIKISPNADGSLDCSTVIPCSGTSVENCTVNHLDYYTSSFNTITDINFSAIWLRTSSYFLTNSAITDVLGGGVSMVSGGSYTRSDARVGYIALVKQSVFVGETQPNNKYAYALGPINAETALECDNGANNNPCILKDEGVSYLMSNFNTGQRMLSIYDGPMQQDSNAYLDIQKTIKLSDKFLFRPVLGIPKDTKTGECYLPHAAIAWKQPNGFYYPPAFHSTNLFFDNVDIRHFVIVPRFIPGTAKTIDQTELDKLYCTGAQGMFTGYSDVDRQTFLNDDDGTLTGRINDNGGRLSGKSTISISEDPFFRAPIEEFECLSENTAKTSPYQYVTTAIVPSDYSSITKKGNEQKGLPWASACTNFECYGVPLYRQLLTDDEFDNNEYPYILLMGQGNAQRSSLTINNGVYFLDTTVSRDKQKSTPSDPGSNAFIQYSEFAAGKTYNVFFLFTTPETKQTYQIYVGKNFNPDSLKAIKTELNSDNFDFQPAQWPTQWTKRESAFDASTGILTVKIDMSGFKTKLIQSQEEECNGNTICTWDSSQNVCGCNSASPFYNECIKPLNFKPKQRTTCSWVGNDVACPLGGCVGFSFTLPSGFVLDDLGSKTQAQGGYRPNPQKYSSNKELWDVSWKGVGCQVKAGN
ncbi:G8 domain-containing protein [Thiotrichales bacterium 19S3-7]|nr:G8 domain-containing protein [Thiotrichales bacterium 19S3-7]MCF6802082.1 G8 domain-containing protein [Thiotrichales bacterium 19S3-11]